MERASVRTEASGAVTRSSSTGPIAGTRSIGHRPGPGRLVRAFERDDSARVAAVGRERHVFVPAPT